MGVILSWGVRSMGEELRGGTSVARFARAAWAGALGGALAGVGEAVAAIVAVDSSERWPLVHLAVTGAPLPSCKYLKLRSLTRAAASTIAHVTRASSAVG